MGKTVALALRWAGADIVIHDDQFTQDTGDPEWLHRAGVEGWAIITKDKRIRYNPLEKAALMRANVQSFVLVAGNMTGIEMARAMMNALARMNKLCVKQAPPFIAHVTSAGKISIIVLP